MPQVSVQMPSEDEDFDVRTEDVDFAAISDTDAQVTSSKDDSPSEEAEATATPSSVDSASRLKIATEEPTDSIIPEVTQSPKVAAQPYRQPSKQAKPLSKHYFIELILFVVIIALALLSWTLNTDKHDLSQQVASLNANPQAAVQRQTQSLIATVGKLMKLPQGETPTVAVLLYSKAGEAILYRPSTNKVILVAPLSFTNALNSSSTSSATTK
jgi:hypothetical protein